MWIIVSPTKFPSFEKLANVNSSEPFPGSLTQYLFGAQFKSREKLSKQNKKVKQKGCPVGGRLRRGISKVPAKHHDSRILWMLSFWSHGISHRQQRAMQAIPLHEGQL